MRARYVGAGAALVTIGAIVALMTGSLPLRGTTASGTAAAGAGTGARTPWGDPDLQGVWRYEAAIALERPAEFKGRESLTDEEVAARSKTEEEQSSNRLAGQEGAAVGRRSV